MRQESGAILRLWHCESCSPPAPISSCAALLCFVAALYPPASAHPSHSFDVDIHSHARSCPSCPVSAVGSRCARRSSTPTSSSCSPAAKTGPPSVNAEPEGRLQDVSHLGVVTMSRSQPSSDPCTLGPPRTKMLKAALIITAAPAMPAAPTSCSVMAGRPAFALQTSSTRSSSASLARADSRHSVMHVHPLSPLPFADAQSATRSS